MEKALEKALAALYAYYGLTTDGRCVSRHRFQRVISDVVQALQSVLIAQAAIDPTMKEKVRNLIAVARAASGKE